MKQKTFIIGDLLMVSASLAWGFSYIFMKFGLRTIPPMELGFLRFAIAFPFLLLLFRRRAIPNCTELGFSAVLGLFIFLLTAGYNFGLKTTDASTAGFLAGATVAVVPVLKMIRDRSIPEKKTLVGVSLAFCGVALISLKGGFSIDFGVLCCIGGAIAYAFHILLNDTVLIRCRPLPIALWQLGFAGLYCGTVSFFTEKISFHLSLSGWLAVFGLAFVSSAYGYVVQTFAQQKVAPERIGLIYSLEPVFCAILAFIFFGEVMNVKKLVGALMILISIILS